jgi:two-component system alkaline phosphatase synthesis response regulator PhoP
VGKGSELLTSRKKVLAVEDEEDILELVEYNLNKHGFQVLKSMSGEEGLKLARSKLPDAVVLDLMLPDLDGLEVCRALKGDPATAHIPIVMLTAKGEEADVVSGLEMGADDYLPKPFSPRVLVARVKAVIRRRKQEPTDSEEAIKAGDLVIHPGRREVLLKGKPIGLTFTEFGILHLMARRPGWVFTRYQIVEGVRGEDYAVTDRAVDVQIVGLRRKLGKAGALIETVRGVGYRFKE